MTFVALSVGELVGYLKLDKTQWDRGLTQAETSTSKTMKAIGTVGIGVAALGVGAFFKSAIGGASDLNETVSKVGVIFGDQSGAIQDFTSDANDKLGQTQQKALDAAATFGVFGKAAGLTGQPLTDFSTDLLGLATDMASFSNTSVDEAVVAIGSALRGESEPIRSYGVLLDDATLRARAMKLGLIDSVKDGLTPQQKALAAQAEIMAQTADAQGDFARTSDGVANKQKIAAAKTAELTAKVGKFLLPAWSTVLSIGIDLIDMFTDHSAGLALAAKITGIVAGLIFATFIPSLLAMGAAAVVSAAETAALWFIIKMDSVKAAAASVWSAAKIVGGWVLMGVQSLLAAAKVALAWLIAMGPIALVIAAVIGLTALIVANWDTIKRAIGAAWDWVKDKTAAIWDGIVWFFKNFTLIGLIISNFDKIRSIIAAAWDWISGTTTAVWNAITSFLSDIWEGIKATARSAIDAILGWIAGVMDRIGAMKDALVGGGSGVLGGLITRPGDPGDGGRMGQQDFGDGSRGFGSDSFGDAGRGMTQIIHNHWPPTTPLPVAINSAESLMRLVGT